MLSLHLFLGRPRLLLPETSSLVDFAQTWLGSRLKQWPNHFSLLFSRKVSTGFTCDTCGKSFAQSRGFILHERTHTGVKPFSCDACGKSFIDACGLKVHQRTHTGVKSFTRDACGKSFSQSSNLRQHEIIHTGVKPYKCDTCGNPLHGIMDSKCMKGRTQV